MTKIILAAPCMGKTTYATNNPHIAIDLESSDNPIVTQNVE